MAVKSYEDLLVWQLAMQLSVAVDALASQLPVSERYGLASQMRRAAISIPSNIAEGSARPTRVYVNHLRMAIGSEAELKTQLTLAVQMNYLAKADATKAVSSASEIGRMLRGLIASLTRRLDEGG